MAKRKGLLPAVSLAVLCLAIAIVFIRREEVFADELDIHPGDQAIADKPDDDAAADDVEIIEGLKVTSDYRLEDIPNPYYIIQEDTNAAKERFQLRLVDRVSKNENTDTYTVLELYDYIDKIQYWFSSSAPAPLDTPNILVLFREPARNGDVIPSMVSRVEIRALETDDGLLVPRKFAQNELRRLFLTNSSKEFSDFLHSSKRLDEYDPEEYGPTNVSGGYGFSALLSESAPLEYDSLIMGELYGLSFYTPYGNDEFDEGHIILRIPKSVPRGMTAVFKIDVTKEQNYRELLNKRAREEAQRTGVNVSFDDRIIGNGGYWIRFQAEFPDGQFRSSRRIILREGFVSNIDELGGRFIISRENPRVSYMVYLIERLESRDIRLPHDADIVVDPEDLVSFEVEVPYNMLPDNALFLSLLLEKGSPLYVSSSFFGFGKVNERDSRFKEGYQPDSVPMKSLPGEYYVTYTIDFLSIRSRDDVNVIGRVVISDEDEGETLQVLPLE